MEIRKRNINDVVSVQNRSVVHPIYMDELNNLIDEVNAGLDAFEVPTVSTDTISESTSGSGVTIDGLLIKDTSISYLSFQMGWIAVAGQQAITANGAIAVTSYYTTMNTTGGAKAYTLANGTLKGQLKKIYFLTDDGDAVITATFFGTNTTLTFANADEYVILIWTGTSWYPIEGKGGTYA